MAGTSDDTETDSAQLMKDKADNLMDRLGVDTTRVAQTIVARQSRGEDTSVPAVANELNEDVERVRRWMSKLRGSINATDRWWAARRC